MCIFLGSKECNAQQHSFILEKNNPKYPRTLDSRNSTKEIDFGVLAGVCSSPILCVSSKHVSHHALLESCHQDVINAVTQNVVLQGGEMEKVWEGARALKYP